LKTDPIIRGFLELHCTQWSVFFSSKSPYVKETSSHITQIQQQANFNQAIWNVNLLRSIQHCYDILTPHIYILLNSIVPDLEFVENLNKKQKRRNNVIFSPSTKWIQEYLIVHVGSLYSNLYVIQKYCRTCQTDRLRFILWENSWKVTPSCTNSEHTYTRKKHTYICIVKTMRLHICSMEVYEFEHGTHIW
jgi:hypothetical protein